jgi:Ca2+/Na+ antiporter
MNTVIIILFILGCLSAFKAFTTENSKQKKLFGLIAVFLGGVLYALGNNLVKF